MAKSNQTAPATATTPATAPAAPTAEQVASVDPRALGAFVRALPDAERPDLGTEAGFTAAVARFLAAEDKPAVPAGESAPVSLALHFPDGKVSHVETFPGSGRGSSPAAGSPLALGIARKRAQAAAMGAVLVRLAPVDRAR